MIKQPKKHRATPERQAALRALYAIDVKRAYASQALNSALARLNLGAEVRPKVTELVYGTLRQRGLLDWYIQGGSGREVAEIDPWVRNILRLALYQCFFLKDTPVAVVVDQAVELARGWGHAGQVRFVNGVLRGILRRKEEISLPNRDEDLPGYLAVRYSHPRWLVELWLEQQGEGVTEALLVANNQRKSLDLRVNTLKTTRTSLAQNLRAQGWEVQESVLVPEVLRLPSEGGAQAGGSIFALPAFTEGLFVAQDEAAALVAHILAPEPGQRIWDMASAPGGKTTHLAALMQNRGQILATELYPQRLELVKENCLRLGVECVTPLACDARALPAAWRNWQPDKILLDAPCSGLGVLQGKADLRWHKKPDQFAELVQIQRELLEAASHQLCPGGELCYSTCTINYAENQGQIAWFLAKHPEFSLVPFAERLPCPDYPPQFAVQAKQGCLQLLPGAGATAGFFIALLQKAG